MSRVADYTSMNSLENAILEICPKYQIYLDKNRFDIIATELSHAILNTVPFKDKSSLNLILIGACPSDVKNKGYLAWHIYHNLNLSKYHDKSIIEIKELLNNKEIQQQLEFLYNLCQNFLIKPITNIMLDKSDNIRKCDMNKLLNLNKLEKKENRQGGWICREIYMRLVSQDLMEKYKYRNRVYYTTIDNIKGYTTPEFILPKGGYSQLHQQCITALESIIRYLNKNTDDKYVYENEFKYDLAGYSAPARADILIIKNGLRYGIIEADGEQHYKYNPHFHNPNNDRKNNEAGYQNFLRLQEKDKKKDARAKELCNGKECLRIPYFTKYKDIKQQINDWIKG